MKKYELTPEHEEQLKPWAEKWIANAMSTAPYTEEEKEKLKDAVEGLYKAADLDAPPRHRIVFVPSPFVLRFAGGFAAAIWHLRKHGTATDAYDATYDAIDDAANAATRAATFNATDAATEEATDAATYAGKKWFSVNLKAYISVSNQYGLADFGLKCAAKSWKMWQGGNQWSGWAAFLSFFRHVAKLPLDYSKWEHYEVLASAGPRIMHSEFCMISERPTGLKVDEQNRPHCENGPFCQWSTGEALYAFNGVRVPAEWIESPESLTPEIALNWVDVEQRRAACEILGWHNVLEHPSLNPKIINEDEPHIGTLIEVDLPDAPEQWFLKYQCGTGRWFAESVNDKSFDTALKANAGGNGWRPGAGDPENFIPFIRT